MNEFLRSGFGAGEVLSPPAPPLYLEKANPFSMAWDWLQEKAAHRRGMKYLAQQRKAKENAPLTDNQRKRAALSNMAQIPDTPITPEQQEQMRQYIDNNFLVQSDASMPPMQFIEEE